MVESRYRAGRTILLTTHHMDEADILSDRIAIMAQGKVRCVGSPLFLKRRYGGGIAVALTTPNGTAQTGKTQELVELFRKHIPLAEMVPSGSHFEITFKLPYEDQNKFGALFAELEEHSAALGIESYGVSASSIQEVFLEVLTRETETNDEVSHEDDCHLIENAGRLSTDISKPFLSPTEPSEGSQSAIHRRATGARLWFLRFVATLLKRKQSAFRDRKAVLSTIVLPALFIWLAMIVATLFPPVDEPPPLNLHSGTPLRQNCAASGGSTGTQVPYADLYNTSYAYRISVELQSGTPSVPFVNLSEMHSFKNPSSSCGQACAYANNVTSWLLDTHAQLAKTRRVVVSLEGAHDPAAALSLANLSRLDPLSAFAWSVSMFEILSGHPITVGAPFRYDNTAFHSSGVGLSFLSNGILLANSGNKTDAVLRPRIDTINFPLNKTSEEKIEQYLNSATDLVRRKI